MVASGVDSAQMLTDGRLLTWGDRAVRIWDIQSGQCIAVLEGHTNWVSGVVVLSGGRLLSRSSDNSMRVWDGQSGQCLMVIEEPVEGIKRAIELKQTDCLNGGMQQFHPFRSLMRQ
jgi:WD40 repeat protein